MRRSEAMANRIQQPAESGMQQGLVVGTAGHIDHGKTSLVRMLTGIDLDALPEEQARGITIALGFTPLALASGKTVSLVDVPGHEALVRTMISGATGLDAAMLCISAADGAMPQTREHLAILDLLGVDRGVIVLTMVDTVDREMVELAAEEARDLVRGTFLEHAPVVLTSAETGEGREPLLDALEALEPRSRDRNGPFRLPVDRAFTRAGFGTVVTGTAWSGDVAEGEQLVLLPGEQPVRARGVEVHAQSVERAHAGQRVAIKLSGIEHHQVGRGTWICADPGPKTSMIDVLYTHLPQAPELDDGVQVRLLVGTSEHLGRLHLATEEATIRPGHSYPAQVRFEQPMFCEPADRFILRWTSPVITLGGGRIVDPFAPRLRRKHRHAHGLAIRSLAEGDHTVWLDRAGEAGLTPAEWGRRAGEQPAQQLGDRVFSARVIGRLEGALLEALATFHATSPLSLGAQRRELRRERLGHLDDAVFDGLVARLEQGGTVTCDGPIVRLTSFEATPTETQQALMNDLFKTISGQALAGISARELHRTHPQPEVEALARLLESQQRIRWIPQVGWVDEQVLDDLRQRLRGHFAAEAHMAPPEFKALTGLSRKTAIPLLEWMDKTRWTARRGDVRIAGESL